MARKRTAPVVAIDGPAGAGKSTVSRMVAERLNYTLLDTGALYRCVGLAAHQAGKGRDPESVVAIAQGLAERGAIEFKVLADGRAGVFLDGQDVSDKIRSQEVSDLASRVSAIAAVRDALLSLQRKLGGGGRTVVEGRDIGSVVFPDAEAKFFLTASVEARASRRYSELRARSESVTLQQVHDQVEERDRRDSGRPIAPLKQAEDAQLVDSTALGIEEVVNLIVDRVQKIESELARK